MYCNRLHAWWSTQTQLATLLSPLIARWWVGLQTLWRFRLKDLSIGEMVGAWCFGCWQAHGVNLLDFFCSGIQFYALLSPYLCFISFLYLELYFLGDDAWKSYGYFMQIKHLCVLIHIWTKGEVGAPWNEFKPSSKIFLLNAPRRYFSCGSFVLFMSCVCHAFASVHCCLVVTWRKRADLLALVCDVYHELVAFPFSILGQVWYLIVSNHDPCCLSYFV